jgi:hypothetical protein
VSVATPATKPKGGLFGLHAKALHGNPFDGQTLGPVVTELEQLTGIATRRTGWAAITSRPATATASTPCWPPPALLLRWLARLLRALLRLLLLPPGATVIPP